jgi:hypothetical protein
LLPNNQRQVLKEKIKQVAGKKFSVYAYRETLLGIYNKVSAVKI